MAELFGDGGRNRVVDGVIVGNVYNKYTTGNPIARRLIKAFLRTVTELYRKVSARTVLEVGCGEGLLAQHLIESGPPPDRFVACDLSLAQVHREVNPKIEWQVASVYALPYRAGEFELVVCCEVLEHLNDPPLALRELTRVSARAVLISTPREPLWRILNVARGRYLSALGNTPGHIQHFSKARLHKVVETQCHVVECRSPLPWTVILCEPKQTAEINNLVS